MKDRNSRNRTILWIVIVVAAAGAAGLIFRKRAALLRRSPIEAIRITGAVLRQDADPQKQSPIANAQITATGGLFDVDAKSDASGYFQLYLRPALRSRQPVTLTLEHNEYKPLEASVGRGDRLYVLRMEPLSAEPAGTVMPARADKLLPIRDVRVRYTMKDQNTMNVGVLAKQFEVVNTGNVPCPAHETCSPDRRWKAATGTLNLDAGGDNQFRNARVTCIAGPCPFTSIRPLDSSRPSRIINVSVLNWSDTTSFLVEAEVIRTAVTDVVRRSYPTLIGQTMTFALPASAEGPTLEANLNGEEIVFPLGPRLNLSWATCSVEGGSGQNRTYRCELKPGFHFPL